MALRVVVCFTGGVGSQVIRLLHDDPGFELVGVLVHHEDKDGRDAGELVGIGPIGVTATRDVDALVALQADAMSWHGLTYEPGIFASFLAAGTNVYSNVGGWYLPGQPEFDELEAAAQAGGATLLAGGNIPGLISEVLPMFVSGYSSRVRMIRAWQSDHVPNYPSADQLTLGLGFGVPPQESAELSPVDAQQIWAIGQSAQLVAVGLGIPFDEVRITKKEYGMAPEDLVLQPSGLRIAAGTPAGVRWTFTAFSDGRPYYELVNEQTALLGLGEGWRTTEEDPNWRVQIEGTPTIVCTFDVPHDESLDLDHVAALNAARAVNCLPRIVAGPPGCRTVLDVPAPMATGIVQPTG
ncbi:MAG: dihydrodipicolinate reductase [Frankiales bacterium]|nr:dihydrodipicolinate reductase [Frankiales bacterium]